MESVINSVDISDILTLFGFIIAIIVYRLEALDKVIERDITATERLANLIIDPPGDKKESSDGYLLRLCKVFENCNIERILQQKHIPEQISKFYLNKYDLNLKQGMNGEDLEKVHNFLCLRAKSLRLHVKSKFLIKVIFGVDLVIVLLSLFHLLEGNCVILLLLITSAAILFTKELLNA